jgi:cytochrome c biogenesis protein CcmG/thiol:disulfide interchange protein DsbE
MNRNILSVIILVMISLSAPDIYAQGGGMKIPSVKLKTLDGTLFDTDAIMNDGKPIVISFWATWCKPCVNELNAIAENYKEWQDETGVKVIAISVDDSRTSGSVKPFASGKNWEYEIYLDPNGDFKRAMNVNTVPHTFLINSNREVIGQHTTYAPGDEEKLFEEIKKLTVK